ncbi:uncharacterized protein [Panulirus ornatus]|uniref:uncharacterized protein isoform X2 n=1 Tax=Panulirus ornatus TaxID=150431 RepID=UPI003A83BB27
MVGRAGWFLLVLVWVWSARWPPVLASQAKCDVEALRCDVICSFPDLDLHCSRCIRRRPMRFGKRSGEAADPLEEAQLGGTLLTRISSVGSRPLYRTRSHKKSTSATSRAQTKRASAGMRAEHDSRPLNAGLHLFSKVLWNDAITKDVLSRKLLQQSHDSEVQSGLYPRGLSGDLPPRADDSEDVAKLRLSRRSVRNTSLMSEEDAGMATGSGPSRLRRFPVFRKFKRSGVHDVIEGLMELLGLEELPVDPTLYGCHELLLPVFK